MPRRREGEKEAREKDGKPTELRSQRVPREKNQTKRENFLGQMEELVPWAKLVELIEPHYPKGEWGHPPKGIEKNC